MSDNRQSAADGALRSLKAADQSAAAPGICSFFAGAGFLDLGFEFAGFEVQFVNEIHGPFLDAYKFSRTKLSLPHPRFGYFQGDIDACLTGEQFKRLRRIVAEVQSSGRPIGFIGGPPCPDFSVGGKNRGQFGANGRLSKSYIDAICKVKPDFFIFENVKGLYRTHRHREFFESLKSQLAVHGYSFSERLLNAIEFGAPQDRDRIILFGIRGDGSADISKFNWNEHVLHDRNSAFQLPWPGAEPLQRQRRCPAGVVRELTVQHWFEKNRVETHANATHQFTPRAGLSKFEVIPEGDDSKKSYKRLHRWRYSPTAAYGNNEVHLHPYLPRRISVAEALAIQSLPREFEMPPDMTLSNMFKAIGNGVPFLASLAIAKTVMSFLARVRR